MNFEKLKQELSSELLDDSKERYEFTWPDKRKAILNAITPTNKTLRPNREESKDFDTTQNLYIEGDNLEVLKLLQKTYLGKVKMIYIDPPYNTGNDFIYQDNFKQSQDDYNEQSSDYDDDGNRLVSNPSSNGRFHTDWLNMIYPRLKLARDLLTDDGVIFISIDDNEQANLKKVCDEIFGEGNFVGCAGRITKKSNNKGDFWAPNFDFILTYVKSVLSAEEFLGGINISAYNLIETDGPRKGEKYQLVRLYMSTIYNRNPEQRFWITCPDGSKIIPPGTTFPPERPNLGDGIWRWTKKKFEEERERIVIKEVKSSNLLNEDFKPAKWNVYTKTYLNDVINNSTAKPNNFIEGYINQMSSHELNELSIPFDYAKPSELIKHLMSISKTNDDSLILDFFSGSATTAHAVMKLNAEDGGNRKFIMVQLPEVCDEGSEAYKAGYKNICEIGKERIRRAGQKIKDESPLTTQNLDVGFRVLKVDSSNMKDVFYKPNEVTGDIFDNAINNIKEDRTGEDLLFQVLLDMGISLSSKIEKKKIKNKEVFYVYAEDEKFLIASFDRTLNDEVVTEIAKEKPQYFVMRDTDDDKVRINFEQIFKAYSPDTTRKVL